MATLPNTQPIFPKTVFHWQVKLTTQVTGRDVGASVPIELGTAGTNGSLIHSIYAIPLGTNVDTVLRLYLRTEDSAAYMFLLEQDLGASNDPGAAAAMATVDVPLPLILPGNYSGTNRGLHLPANGQLTCSLGTAVATGWIVHVLGGDY